MRPVLAVLLVWILWSGPAAADAVLAAEARAQLADGGSAAAVEIIDGDTLVLDDGREVRLVGIQAPKLPLGRTGFKTWPLAEDAKQALSELALGKSLSLAYGGRRVDRHRRALAHLFGADDLWIQGELLRRGLARVYSFADNRALVPQMLMLEAEARGANRGIWANPFYTVRTAENVERHVGGFEVVEGQVVDVAIVRGRAYLNFGADWRSDFTVTLAPDVRRQFESEGIAPDSYRGRRVRVRGWIKSFNGPMIEATHPEQIEVLSP